jgi:hypothetical protein
MRLSAAVSRRTASRSAGHGRILAAFLAATGIVVGALLLLHLLRVRHPQNPPNKNADAYELVTDRAVVAAQLGFDAYFAGLTPCDLAARRAASPAGARAEYLAAVVTRPAARELASLAAHVRAARALLPRIRLPALGALEAALPWRVVLLADSVESGWPHTHGELICLPRSFLAAGLSAAGVATLLHERVHVCQRVGACQPPPEPAPLVSVAEFDARFPDLARRRRSNPDLDAFLYDDGAGRDADAAVTVALFDDVGAAARGGLGAARHSRVDLATGEVLGPAREPHEHPNEAMANLFSSGM